MKAVQEYYKPKRRNVAKNISNREKQILYLVANEYSSREIADKLFISNHTVISHRQNLMLKLGVRNTAGLVRVGFELKILMGNNRLTL